MDINGNKRSKIKRPPVAKINNFFIEYFQEIKKLIIKQIQAAIAIMLILLVISNVC
jgi:hypothetical protein